ncbi:MAG: PQQ-dependent sugar dehydrogenase [Chitinophagaceae bacterium]|nr:PQQ-dependent sugar dehydrogenase [Chitinophagaceae bacterium]
MRKKLLSLVCCCIYFISHAQLPQDFMIPAKVTVDELQPAITISWPANANASSYTIKRKTVTDSSYLLPFTTIGTISNAADATQFTDNDITAGILYEYEISGSFTPSAPASRNTFICAGIKVLPTHKRGSIILLCESSIAASLENKINTLYKDLVGDGWKVIRINIPASEDAVAVTNTKNTITTTYQNNPDLKQVLILGHVPVPYSGDLGPDGHTDHIGCWPADGYYGNMESTWTDTITSNTLAGARPQNKNFPGDGKFDQNTLTAVRLAVGRIDLANLPAFSITETSLLNRYLDKNHLFRNGETQLNKQALIDDALPSFVEKFSQSAWKSYAATVGYDNVLTGQYETDLVSPTTYLWSYGCGAGIYTGASGVSQTSDFVTKSYKTVFTQLFGSYFGDWDSQDNFMRSSLASAGNTLTCVWGGRPHWYFHHMSTGSPIGYSALLSMNNNMGTYNNPGSSNGMIHMGLMGDPSLRSSYVKPVKNMAASLIAAAVKISWNTPAENDIAGYYIYRSSRIDGIFKLLNQDVFTDTSYIDHTPLEGKNFYMVRTLKLDTVITAGNFPNHSTYYNLATGAIDSVFFNTAAPQVTLSLQPLAPSLQAIEPKQVVVMGNSVKRYFVGEKSGSIKLFDDSFHLLSTYLSVYNINEGFLSMAFHPDFARNKLLYVFYTNPAGNLELARYRENNSTTTASLQDMMITIPVNGNTKNLGGEIHFGSDGFLYISTGDGDTKDALLNNAQNTNSLLGKILRIKPDISNSPPFYSVPADNPFGNEVFATGLRFPYRWDFDKLTRDVWIGERGDSSIEEINRIPLDSLKGTNFGWRCYQGTDTFNASGCGPTPVYNFPVYQFPSATAGGVVTGGTVYRGETFINLKGCYVFADAKTGKVYLSRYDSTERKYNTASQQLAPKEISDISADENGELFVTSRLGGVYRLEADGARLYRFSGNGNWDNPNNWSNKTIPPSVLSFGSEIIISPANGGECILNVPQTIPAGSKITIINNQHFKIAGDLIIQ